MTSVFFAVADYLQYVRQIFENCSVSIMVLSVHMEHMHGRGRSGLRVDHINQVVGGKVLRDFDSSGPFLSSQSIPTFILPAIGTQNNLPGNCHNPRTYSQLYHASSPWDFFFINTSEAMVYYYTVD